MSRSALPLESCTAEKEHEAWAQINGFLTSQLCLLTEEKNDCAHTHISTHTNEGRWAVLPDSYIL